MSMNKQLKFNEKLHEYTVDGKKLISVTTLVKKFCEPFDGDKSAESVAFNMNKAIKQLVKLEYVSVSDEIKDRLHMSSPFNKTMIKSKWKMDGDMASKHGTEVHEALENYINKKAIVKFKDSRSYAKYVWGIEYLESLSNVDRIEPEMRICHLEHGIAGTIDTPIYLKNGRVLISDWKTNKEIKIVGFRGLKMKEPLQHLDDCNYTHYNLQLSVYAYILEDEYGITIDGLEIVHLMEGEYRVYNMPYLRDEVISMIEANKK